MLWGAIDMMHRCFLVGMCFFAFSPFSLAVDINFEEMDSIEDKFNKRQSSERVVYMPLDTLYPDNQVRALAEAAGKGDIREIQTLISEGVEVNSLGTKGVTPLFWALKNINGFEKLLELGANPNIIFDGSSVMHWASRSKNTEFLQKAIKYGGNPNLAAGQLAETPIFKTIGVVGSDNVIAMKILLDAGADINAKTGDEKIFGIAMGGKTPVMIAADLARYDIVFILLNRGADYKLKDDNGRDLNARIKSMEGRFAKGSKQEKDLAKVMSFLSEVK